MFLTQMIFYRIESKEKGRGGIPPKCGLFFFLMKKKKKGYEMERETILKQCQ